MGNWRSKSREVLQINSMEKLEKLLIEQRMELTKQKVSTGKRRMGTMNVKASASITKKTKKNIARIKTRMNQLKQKDMK